MKTRIMLIEDNREFREVVALALNEVPGFVLDFQVGTAESALTRLCETASPRPDVILLDLRLPGMSGLAAIPLISECAPDSKIIILSQSGAETDVLNAISRGAAGYLLKSATALEIVGGINTVLAGGAPLDPSVAHYLLKAVKRNQGSRSHEVELSQREMEILALMSEGLVKKQIADRLNISYTTVDSHVGHIYEKLRVGNAPAAVGRAFRLGLLSGE